MQYFTNLNGEMFMQGFYKKLSCKNYYQINQQILTHIEFLNLVDNTQSFWNEISAMDFLKSVPLFQEWLNQHHLKLYSLAVTVGYHKDCCPVHVDTPPAVNKLSWPVSNTKNTFNRWFRPRVKNPTIKVNELGGTSYLDLSQLEEIARMEVIEPCIINAGIPHDVWCDSTAKFPRIGLQCMLFKEPQI